MISEVTVLSGILGLATTIIGFFVVRELKRKDGEIRDLWKNDRRIEDDNQEEHKKYGEGIVRIEGKMDALTKRVDEGFAKLNGHGK